MTRLTSPAAASLLPFPQNRFVSSKRRFLIFSSDRTGKVCPFQLDLRTGALHQLADTPNLSPRSLCLDAKERSIYFIDGKILKEGSLANRKSRTIAEDVSAFSAGPSSAEVCMVTRGRLKCLSGGQVLAENVTGQVLLRPTGEGCLFTREIGAANCEIWYATREPANKPVLLATGKVSDPFWSADRQTVLFLRILERENAFLAEIHEAPLDGSAERRVAPTSEFAAFAPNENTSVFVGASRSKAQPNVVLLLRSVQRELTLCEHRASNPAAVSPVFSPDSRRIYFDSDREGKSALYSVNVESLVEPTPLSGAYP